MSSSRNINELQDIVSLVKLTNAFKALLDSIITHSYFSDDQLVDYHIRCISNTSTFSNLRFISNTRVEFSNDVYSMKDSYSNLETFIDDITEMIFSCVCIIIRGSVPTTLTESSKRYKGHIRKFFGTLFKVDDTNTQNVVLDRIKKFMIVLDSYCDLLRNELYIDILYFSSLDFDYV